MPLQGVHRLLPAAVKHVFPAQVVHIPVVFRVLLHRQLQQRQILPPGFGVVGVVLQPDFIGKHRPGLPFAAQHLVDWVHPAPPLAGVDFVPPEGDPSPPSGRKFQM